MVYSIQQIADAIGAEAFGNTDLIVERVTEPAMAGANDLALLTNPKFAGGLAQGSARAAMLWPGADWQELGLEAAIESPRGRYGLSGLSALMDPGQHFGAGIHASAVIDPTAEIGENVAIGPLVVIGARAKIGANSIIGPQCSVGADATLGANAYLREMVSIGARATIGARFIAQPGVRVASDGFSFVTPEKSGVEAARETLGDQGDVKSQEWTRIHSLGSVTIGDDVELGANTCIDCGTIRDTRIGNGVKMDNLVHIAHNVVIGDNTILAGQCGIAGSTVIGKNVVMGGQCGVTDNTTVGDNVIAGGATKMMSKVPAGRVVLGSPAVKMETHLEMYKGLRRLPRLIADVAKLQKTISKPDTKD
ncbi:UDP-3-O-[3-hydroxymyristoyl] glucosamine N-acyltransferase [Shimia gijangensis]|uniref:UDP-3-O-[3-hydroxymyristoyl] glucosamine N-acyltransferase n=1 Tax=Shimia gijangensis TaxID=1470563 RepID=A0A1M6PTR7_9RHOB|nr:UDP-3-O-(3-hydroxymyristoyl)glucosamine N-acyltransferase [Shimia gijangensis]SHK11301.1 UDP-3-O-[3-hydroxymyristoyl] glucosamine N-acyltransferase [Shimia gijangensis]